MYMCIKSTVAPDSTSGDANRMPVACEQLVAHAPALCRLPRTTLRPVVLRRPTASDVAPRNAKPGRLLPRHAAQPNRQSPRYATAPARQNPELLRPLRWDPYLERQTSKPTIQTRPSPLTTRQFSRYVDRSGTTCRPSLPTAHCPLPTSDPWPSPNANNPTPAPACGARTTASRPRSSAPAPSAPPLRPPTSSAPTAATTWAALWSRRRSSRPETGDRRLEVRNLASRRRSSAYSLQPPASSLMRSAFLFPGQGAQAVGMAAALAASLPAAKALFDRAADILDYNLLDLCTHGPEAKLNSTVHSQPALFVASLAALEKLKADAPGAIAECAATAGLSLGEYTALVFAGAMDFDAGLRVVAERGRAMQDAADAQPSGMVSILGLERDQVDALCHEAARRRGPAGGQPPLPRQHRCFRRPRGLRPHRPQRRGRRRHESHPVGGRGRVSHVAHAARRRPPEGCARGRNAPSPADPGNLQRRRPNSRQPRGNPRLWSVRSSAPCFGKTRCASCWSTCTSRNATKSVRAASWPGFSRESKESSPAKTSRRDQ